MLDVLDFLIDKGGDPKKIIDSQQRRYAPTSVVEKIQTLYEDARTCKTYEHSPCIEWGELTLW